ncbi:MAG: hypothetical protein ACRCTJ_03160 [Brevinema sp.]
MKKYALILCLLVSLSPKTLFTQSSHEVIIKDFTGDAQYQSPKSKSWIPLIAGIKVSEKNFIRLNSKDSILTMELPDGGLLRLIGVGSIFIDYLSKNENKILQHKFLLISGRWFYSNSRKNDTRMFMNTDITTSIIENGSGGGFFFSGTNEFIIRTGKGITSYREQDSRALVVDERQFVSFNIYDGFSYPELATAKKFAEYIISLDKKNQDFPFVSEDSKAVFSSFEILEKENFDKKMNRHPKKALSMNEINSYELDPLCYYNFETNSINNLQIELATSSLAPKIKEDTLKLVEKPKINPALLKGIDLNNFTVESKAGTKRKKIGSGNSKDNNTSARKITRTKATATRSDLPQKSKSAKKNSASEDNTDTENTLDVDDLLNSLSEKARLEREKRNKKSNATVSGAGENRQKAKVVTESITNRPKPVAKPTPKAGPTIERKVVKKVIPKVTPSATQSMKPKSKPVAVEKEPEEEIYEDEYPEEQALPEWRGYEAGNQEHDPNDSTYNVFQIESQEDLLNSEFSRVLFGT